MLKLFSASMNIVVLLGLTGLGCKAANFMGTSGNRRQAVAASHESLPVQTEPTAEDKELQARKEHQNVAMRAEEVKSLALSSALDAMAKVSDLAESMPKTDEELKNNLNYQQDLVTTATAIIAGVAQIEKVAEVVGPHNDAAEAAEKLALIGSEKQQRNLQLQSQEQSPTELLKQASGAVSNLLRNEVACSGVVASARADEQIANGLSVKTVQQLLQRLLFGFDVVMKSCLAKVASPTDCNHNYAH